MNKSIFCIAALILTSSAFAAEPRINSTRDGGGYEATLRVAGVPLSGGLAWATHNPQAGVAEAIQHAAAKAASGKVAVAKVAKTGKAS